MGPVTRSANPYTYSLDEGNYCHVYSNVYIDKRIIRYPKLKLLINIGRHWGRLNDQIKKNIYILSSSTYEV